MALTLNGGVDDPTSQVCSSVMLILRLQKIEKYDFRLDSDDATSILNCIQIRPAVLELNHADTQTRKPYMWSFRAVRSKNALKYLRVQSVPQREHHTSPLQRSTG
jgi:hypothetical protein